MTGSPRQERYAQALKRNLAAELADPPLTLCPKCGQGWILPGTTGARLGVCQACYLRGLAEAERLAAEELRAAREYDAMRARKSRALRAMGKLRDEEQGHMADSGRL